DAELRNAAQTEAARQDGHAISNVRDSECGAVDHLVHGSRIPPRERALKTFHARVSWPAGTGWTTAPADYIGTFSGRQRVRARGGPRAFQFRQSRGARGLSCAG